VLLAVDPGLRGCGVALFNEGRLWQVAYLRGSKDSADASAWGAMAAAVAAWSPGVVTEAVSEFPKVYSVGKSKGDPEDLLQLAAVVGALSVALAVPLRVVRPYEWKRQVPKDIMAGRIAQCLEAGELAAARAGMPAKSYQHNVWDAIGIGLHAVGRLRHA
jgi:hypothetical protein